MTEQEYLLTVLAEECAEVAQRASKAIRFGMDEIQPGQGLTNHQRIEQELGDLLAVAEMLGLSTLPGAYGAKMVKVRKYMDYSRELGLLS